MTDVIAKMQAELASHDGLEPTETCPICQELRQMIVQCSQYLEEEAENAQPNV